MKAVLYYGVVFSNLVLQMLKVGVNFISTECSIHVTLSQTKLSRVKGKNAYYDNF